jgi:hypothetical protein
MNFKHVTSKKKAQQKVELFSGVAENRTRVQTSNQRAFYTFSFRLFFRPKARLETTTFGLALSVSKGI